MSGDAMSRDIAWAATIIGQVSSNEKMRLRRGLMKRQQMQAAIERGETPTGPRADWLRETAFAVLELLQARGKTYNDLTPDDLISTPDMGDVLMTAMGWLRDSAGEVKKKEGQGS